MKFSRAIIILILICSTSVVKSQKVGAVLGMNMTDLKTTNSLIDVYTEYNSGSGIRTGLLFEYVHKIGITAGINTIIALYRYSYTGLLGDVYIKHNYFQMPLYLGYTYTINDEAKIFYKYLPFKVFLTVGPTFAIALNGTSQYRNNDEVELAYDSDINVFSPSYNKHNTQFAFNAGASIGGLFLSLGREIGTTDIVNNTIQECKTRNFYMQVGYFYDFSRKYKKSSRVIK
ncbi:MAG: outer membrane beta-barrel protein [Bacteroidales bacterium]|nr:outer membrane beta-barrel protein [Bacteroidales bacterium]